MILSILPTKLPAQTSAYAEEKQKVPSRTGNIMSIIPKKYYLTIIIQTYLYYSILNTAIFFLKNINLHISEQRLEIGRNGQNLVITFIIYVHSKTFFNISKTNLKFRKFDKI